MSDQMHTLKCWPESFEAIVSGTKTFDLRKQDRPFDAGDFLMLREYNSNDDQYTNRWAMVEVTYIDYHISLPGLAKGYCAMAIHLLNQGTGSLRDAIMGTQRLEE